MPPPVSEDPRADPGPGPGPDKSGPARSRSDELPVLLAVTIGGVIGAETRYGIGRLLPHRAHDFPFSTLLINTSGCLLIGLLMALLLERVSPHRLARPFLGVGILGGYTTFSSFAVDVDTLLRADRAGIAVAYVVATLVFGWLAVWLGLSLIRTLFPARR